MSTSSELTYNIAYPEPGRVGEGDVELSPNGVLNTQNEIGGKDDKPILVILFGWFGAKDSQLEKYSDIYLQRGCIVVRCIISVRVLMYDVDKLPAVASELLNMLKDKNLQSHPTFFHAFSNGGAYVYSSLLRQIAAELNPADFNIRGTIFDSAPMSPTGLVNYRAMKTTSGPYKFLAPVIGIFYLLVFFLVSIGVAIKNWWEIFYTGTFKRLSANHGEEPYFFCNFLTRIWKIKNHPFAFLYSEADSITPFEEVEQIAGVIRKGGNPVKLVKFEGSAHVQHYRKFPKEYILAVTEFIRTTMESYSGQPILFNA